MTSQITSITIVYSTVYPDADQRKHQSSASLAFVWGIHRWPANSPHKGPVTRKMFPFDDVIMDETFVPLSQLAPENPSGHLHRYPALRSKHVPPFWHGLLSHWSPSTKTNEIITYSSFNVLNRFEKYDDVSAFYNNFSTLKWHMCLKQKGQPIAHGENQRRRGVSSYDTDQVCKE